MYFLLFSAKSDMLIFAVSQYFIPRVPRDLFLRLQVLRAGDTLLQT